MAKPSRAYMSLRRREKSARNLQKWKQAVFELSGDAALLHALNQMSDKWARNATRAGLTAAVRKFAIGIRGQIPAPHKNVKKLVGSGMAKAKSKRQGAKAGFSVGPTSKKTAARSGKNVTRSGKLKGVGLSANNIHWAVLGTEQRTVKRTRMYVGNTIQDVTNWNTGKMPAILGMAVEHGVKSKKNAAIKAMWDAIWKQITKDIKKAEGK